MLLLLLLLLYHSTIIVFYVYKMQERTKRTEFREHIGRKREGKQRVQKSRETEREREGQTE